MNEAEKKLPNYFAFLSKYGSKLRFVAYLLIVVYSICLGVIVWNIVREYPYYKSGIQIQADILSNQSAEDECSGCSKLRIAFEYDYFDHHYEFIEDIFVDAATLNAWAQDGHLLVTYVEIKPEAYIIGTAFHDLPLIIFLVLWSLANIVLGIYFLVGQRSVAQTEQSGQGNAELAIGLE